MLSLRARVGGKKWNAQVGNGKKIGKVYSLICHMPFFPQDGRIRHSLYEVCLDVEGESLVVRKCDGRQTQKWRFTSYPEEERTKNDQEKIL